jgi:hypothetical protein
MSGMKNKTGAARAGKGTAAGATRERVADDHNGDDHGVISLAFCGLSNISQAVSNKNFRTISSQSTVLH